MITPRYKGPEVDPHVAWTKVKASAMRKPYLDCGCRNNGVDTYLHLGCARIACQRHADDPHECQHYEPEEPPVEPLVFSLDTSSAEPNAWFTAAIEAEMPRLADLPPRMLFTAPASGWYSFGSNPPVNSGPEGDAPVVDAALDPALDHSSHSMQWVDGCPECPPAQDQPQRRSAAGADLAWLTEIDTAPARRPWWRFW